MLKWPKISQPNYERACNQKKKRDYENSLKRLRGVTYCSARGSVGLCDPGMSGCMSLAFGANDYKRLKISDETLIVCSFHYLGLVLLYFGTKIIY